MANILIVDDRSSDRALYREYLKNKDYQFFELTDGSEVLAFLTTQAIDLILLDWQMANMGGLATLRALVGDDNFSEIPVIVITGFREQKVLKESFDNGSVDFIFKPVSETELNSRVNRIILQKEKLIPQKELKQKISSKQAQLAKVEVSNDELFTNLKEIKLQVKNAHKLLNSGDVSSQVKAKDILRRINLKIEKLNNSKQDWDEKKVYETIEPDFLAKLSVINTKLTPIDLKHCMYMKMNLDNHEIANVLNIEVKSVQMRRYRLRKKLHLTEDQDLLAFLLSLT